MNCPVCNKDNAFDLSICPSCGAMINDTVRAELLPKVSVSKPLPKIDAPPSGRLNQSTEMSSGETVEGIAPAPKIVEQRRTTENISAKLTSPTLVEFHSKKSSVPEWRLQLQNAVRQRQDRENPQAEVFSAPVAAAASRKTKPATSGANALKIETAPEKTPASQKHPKLTSALERIEKSRQKFYVAEEESHAKAPAPTAPRPASKNFPFYIAAKQTPNDHSKTAEPNPAIENMKPSLAATRNESGDLDTNKLPPLASVVGRKVELQPIVPPAKISASFTSAKRAPTDDVNSEDVKLEAFENQETSARETERHEEYEDCAPVALRFNAGLFDLIIGSFLSFVLLAPFILTSAGETGWLSFTGALAFLATCSIVMFIYLTTTVGFYGRTFGMRIFSLEVVDVAGENYPTLHQAAVSAALYLLSLAFAGAGFLTLFFNEDRRAVHDLVSGTIVVKEI